MGLNQEHAFKEGLIKSRSSMEVTNLQIEAKDGSGYINSLSTANTWLCQLKKLEDY